MLKSLIRVVSVSDLASIDLTLKSKRKEAYHIKSYY